MRILKRRDGTGLHQELIDADKTANITCKLLNKSLATVQTHN